MRAFFPNAIFEGGDRIPTSKAQLDIGKKIGKNFLINPLKLLFDNHFRHFLNRQSGNSSSATSSRLLL
jgi:hypothetical protein